MRPSGILLVIAGTWVLAQVLGGNALTRLNITAPKQQPTSQGGPK